MCPGPFLFPQLLNIPLVIVFCLHCLYCFHISFKPRSYYNLVDSPCRIRFSVLYQDLAVSPENWKQHHIGIGETQSLDTKRMILDASSPTEVTSDFSLHFDDEEDVQLRVNDYWTSLIPIMCMTLNYHRGAERSPTRTLPKCRRRQLTLAPEYCFRVCMIASGHELWQIAVLHQLVVLGNHTDYCLHRTCPPHYRWNPAVTNVDYISVHAYSHMQDCIC